MWGAQGDYVVQGNDQWGNGKILLLPTVIVNKHQYRGRLDVPSILRALCAGFSETTEPEVHCDHTISPGDLQCYPEAGSHLFLCAYKWTCHPMLLSGCTCLHGTHQPAPSATCVPCIDVR